MRHAKTMLACAAATMMLSCAKQDDKEPSAPVNPKPIDSVQYGKIDSVAGTYMGKTVSYKTVIAKDGREWLQQNLGSSRVAQSPKDTASFGGFFQWGRWDDGHQIITSEFQDGKEVLTINNPSGLSASTTAFYDSWWSGGNDKDKWSAASPSEVTSTNGCDPCKTLGSEWRIPTKEEWETVLSKEEISGLSTAYNSNLKIPGSYGARNPISSTEIRFDGPGNAGFWTTTTTGVLPGKGSCAYGFTILDYKYYFSEFFPYKAGLTLRCIKEKR